MTAVYPGEVIGSLSSHIPGPGTHVYESNIHASIAGLIVTTNTFKPKPTTTTSKLTISISQTPTNSTSLTSLSRPPLLLPTVGSIILGRVLRVQQRQLTLSILSVLPSSTSSTTTATTPTIYTPSTTPDTQPPALLRREDVRTHEKDKVVMNESYRVGDIVRACVISLGDERNYYVSTAGNEFGVVIAKSGEEEGGGPLVPVSWKEMRDERTGKVERRKVAKPV